MERPLIFVSYSRANEEEKDELLKHLDVLDEVYVWSDALIQPGQSWREEIDAALEQARIGILLITAEFLRSPFIKEAEVPALLRARKAAGVTIFPLIARPCAWQNVGWLNELQVRPRDGRPIWRAGGSVQQRLADITREIGGVLAKKRPPDPPAPRRPSIPHLFAKSDSTEFVAVGEALLQRARRVVLIGTGLNLLHRDPVFTALAERAASGDCAVEIYMADPWSPDVGTRLIEEELGALKPPVGQRGLIQRLSTILDTLDRLGWPEHFSLKLFSHYPTFAMCIIDDDYFFYPYGYALLGNFSPVEYFSRTDPSHAPMTAFLDKQYERVRADAVDARHVFAVRDNRVAPEMLHALAVYFVPAASTPLYHFGSGIIGRDVRMQTEVATSTDAGTAPFFGFHLTIADALYFAGRHETVRVMKEIELLLASFSRFPLTNLTPAAFPGDDRSISLLCEDPTRTLEALHFELVATLYRRAAGSNYTLGLAGRRDRPEPGATTMLQRYHAPYILSCYRPHFSLLTDVDPAQLPSRLEAIGAAFASVPRDIEVSSIAFMRQPSPKEPWLIEKEIPLH